MSKVLITGGSGLIGSRLTELLNNSDHSVFILTRRDELNKNIGYHWDIEIQKSKNAICT